MFNDLGFLSLNDTTMAMASFRSTQFLLVFCFVLILGANADTKACDDLTVEVEALKRQGREQAEMLKKQGEVLDQLKLIVETQNIKIDTQKTIIDDNERRIQNLEDVIADVPSTVDVSGHNINAANDELPGRKEDVLEQPDEKARASTIIQRRGLGIKQHARLVLGSESIVAFHAVIEGGITDHLGINQRIVFPAVRLNIGAGYHDKHGLFIAPQPGLYLFSTSIMSTDTGHVEIYVKMLKNGNVLANAYAHGDSGREDQGSVTVVTQLVAGDEVWISLYGPADTSIWGNSFNSFMGVLIVPM